MTSTRFSGARRRLGLASVTALVLALTSGCALSDDMAESEILRFGFPEPVTDRARNILELWQWSAIAALVVGVIVWGLIFWCLIRYRKRREELPPQVRYNIPLEVFYTVVPFIIVSVLFYYTAVSENYVNELTDDDAVAAATASDELMTVSVIGFRWGWTFNYLDAEGTPVLSVTGTGNEPAEMVLPVGRKVRFILTSPDVIHSFYVPKFLFKRDVIPGRPNTFEVTVDKAGQFVGRCAEYCGADHDRMSFSVRALPQDEYDDFYADALAGRGPTTITVPNNGEGS